MNVRVGGANRGALASLIFGRIVYAINWYNLAAVFFLTASELRQNVSGLGLVTATFYVGVGIFQVPSAILATKIGPRLTAIYGTSIASLAALLTGFASNLVQIAALRFFVGLGMALVFAPCVILITRCMQKGSEGLGVGLYQSAFYLGGAIGLSGWSLLAGALGWRNSLVVSGALGLFTSALLFLSIPKDSLRSNFSVNLVRVKAILFNKWMIGISVAMLALGVGNTVVGNFMAYYVENVIHVGIGGGGAIASLTPIAALATAPFIGRLFDRSGDAKRLLLASGALMAFGVGIAFFGTIYLSILSALLVGLAAGAGFTIGISAARATNSIYPEYETLTVSWVNGFSMFGDFFPPLLFSSLVIRYGYSLAGLCLAGLTFVLTTPLLFLRVSRLERVSDS